MGVTGAGSDEIEDGTHAGVVVGRTFSTWRGSTSVEGEITTSVTRGDIPGFFDSQGSVDVDWGHTLWGVHLTYRSPWRLYLKARYGFAMTRVNFAVSSNVGLPEDETDYTLADMFGLGLGTNLGDAWKLEIEAVDIQDITIRDARGFRITGFITLFSLNVVRSF